MKPQWQKQNEALWAQQKRMKDMAYYQQQTQQKPPPAKNWQPQSNDEFARVEQETLKLKQAFSSGKLDQEAFDKALKKLIIADDQKRWWMLGTESNTWYRYDGQQWLVDTPPGRLNAQALLSNASIPKQSKSDAAVGSGFWIKWVIASVIASAIAVPIAFLVGGFRLLEPNILNNYVPGVLIGLVFGITQLILIGKYTRSSILLLLGYLAAGFLIGNGNLEFYAGLVLGLGNALPAFFILKRDYRFSWLYLILRPFSLGETWLLF